MGTSVAALALAFTAGCGGGGDGGAAGSAEDGSGLTKANFASAVSQAQTKAETAHLEAEMNAQGQKMSMSGDMDMSAKDSAFDLAMRGGGIGGKARFILVDQVIYLQMPALSQGNKFVKIDASDRSDPVAKMFNQMLGQLNPSQAFRAFEATTKLEEKDTAEIDGVETTQYAVTVNTQKALKAQGMAEQVPPGQMPKTIGYNVWVDGKNLVRRLRMDVQGTNVDMNMSRWGEPVEITAPPAKQTTDMSEMMGQMNGSGSSAQR